ncbi:MAG: IPT/TIG domain-containing protein, partial [Candidatus Geothermincolia bacterium]
WNSHGCEIWRTAAAGGPPFTDWVQVNVNGFGSASNAGASSMVNYANHLFVGIYNSSTGCQIWRSAAAGGPPYTDWVQFIDDGFGDVNNRDASTMTVFDTLIFVGTYNSNTGGELWRTNGASGQQVNADGFGDQHTYAVDSLAVHNSALYAGTSSCEIWRTAAVGGPPYTDWAQVNTDGFGDSYNDEATAIASVGSYLYVGTWNTTNGGEVWRGWENATPPFTWTKASQSGFGDADNDGVLSLILHGGELYAGTRNNVTGCQVFKSGGVPPVITSLDPGAADTGTTVTVNGNGFGSDPGTHESTFVSFGAFVPAESDYVSWADGAIQVKVPSGAFGLVEVIVHTAAGGDSNTSTFSVTPHIDGIDPASGQAGSSVTIDGNAFGSARGSSRIWFGTTEAAGYTSWTNTRVVVTVPVLAGTPVTVPVKASTGGGDSNTMDYTEDAPPTLASVTPASGPVGTRVTLAGNNLGAARETSSVKFGGGTCAAADYESWSDTTIVTRLPAGATTGNVTVVKGGNTSNARTFTVTTAPVISSVTPATGAPGDDVTIAGAGFGSSSSGARLAGGTASYVSFGGVQATDITSWSNTQIKCKVPAGSTSSSLSVATAGGTSNGKSFTVIYPRWYLAEGSTAWGFDTRISIENPDDAERTVKVTYNTTDGPVDGGLVTLQRTSQTTLDPRAVLGNKDFSTMIECTSSTTLAVDRTMSWQGVEAASPEAHSSVGVTCPARVWYLPEGSSAWGFETWVLLQNPGASEAVCEVTYMIEGSSPVVMEKRVPPNSRQSFNMKDDIGERDASVRIESAQPVIAERAMYKNLRREGHESVGTTAPAAAYYLAEGTTAWGFTTYVLVQNPNAQPADVTVTYMTAEGAQPQAPFTMQPNSRKTIRVNDVLPNKDFSTQVSGSLPIIAERAMYWTTSSGEACHDSIGMSAAHKAFYLPDGRTTDGRETFVLVQNPNEADVTVEISYLPADGSETVVFTANIGAKARVTFNMKDRLPLGS